MDNMLDISREAFPHPALSRLSSVLHESEAATQRGLDRAFPVSLTGLAEHARRKKNAEDMLGHLQKGDYPHLTPLEVAPLVTDPLRTARLAASGEGFLASIFGSKLDEVVDLVARQAGVSRTSAHVILGLSAPLLLDAVGKETVLRRFDADDLTRFLDVQEQNARTSQPSIVDRASQAAGPSADDAALRMQTLTGYAPPHTEPANQVTPERTEAPRRALRGAQASMAQGTLDTRQASGAQGWKIFLLVASAALLALLGWLAFRMIPRPSPVPARPNVLGSQTESTTPGAQEARSPQDASEALPGGVPRPAESRPAGAAGAAGATGAAGAAGATSTGVDAREPSREASEAREAKPQAPAGAVDRSEAPIRAAGETQRTATQSADIIEDAELELSATRRASAQNAAPPQLAGQEAVDALASVPPSAAATPRPVSPLVDALAHSEAAGQPVPEGEPPSGIAEAIPSQVPSELPAAAMASYFEGGARAPQRFVIEAQTFAPQSSVLRGESAALNDAAKALREHAGAVVLIEGFGDLPNAPEAELAQARAEATRDYLQARGVAANQVRLPQRGATPPATQGDQVNLIVLTR